MVLAFSAYLGRLTCLAVNEHADIVIGKTLRDTPREHTSQLEAQTVVLMLRNKMDLGLIRSEANQLAKLIAFINEVSPQRAGQ